MIIKNPTSDTRECLRFIYLYLAAIEEKMGSGWFLGAYVFGSVAENKGSLYRPVDILFVF